MNLYRNLIIIQNLSTHFPDFFAQRQATHRDWAYLWPLPTIRGRHPHAVLPQQADIPWPSTTQKGKASSPFQSHRHEGDTEGDMGTSQQSLMEALGFSRRHPAYLHLSHGAVRFYGE